MPARSSCGARTLTACVVLSRACWLLHSLPGADMRSSTRARSTRTVAPHLPLSGSKAIPVDVLTASGARARSPDTPRHLSQCISTGAGNPAAGARADRVKSCEPDVAAGAGVRLHRSRDRPDGRAPHVEEGQEAGLAAAALPARSAQEEGHHPPPAGARLLALRLRERGRGGHRSVGPDGLLWTRSVKRRPVVCGSVKRTCAARATTRNQPCVPVASVVSRMLSQPV